VDAAFLLMAAHPGQRPSPRQLALAARADAADLGFRADHHVYWSSADGGIVVGAWERRGDAAAGSRVHVDGSGVALVVGTLRRRGRPWQGEGGWAEELAAAARSKPLGVLASDLEGVFTVVMAAPDGTATVLGDPLGHRCTYIAETDDVVIVSSRAALAAAAATSAGTPRLDVWSACWPAFAGFFVGDRTGFEGVRLLGPGRRVELRPGAVPVIVDGAIAWSSAEVPRGLPTDDVVEQVRAELADALRAVLTYPAAEHVLGLTGGKDSRLLLAVLLGEGLAGDYQFLTIGPPSLGDVQVASALAARFDLDHRVELPRADEPRDYETVVREFVEATAGLVNVIDLHAGLPARDELRVTGLGGEILRNFRIVPERWRGARLVPEFARFAGFGRLQLVRPDLAGEYEIAMRADMLADPAGAGDPLDQLGSFYLRNRVRSARIGPSEEVVARRRALPLSSKRVVGGAFALPAERRQAELVHYAVTRRCCPSLVAEPFAAKGWPAELAAFVDEPVPAARAGVGAEPFVARVRRTQLDRRRPVLRAVFEERGNPAWDVIDPAVALDALERYDALNGPERRQLFGAATAALWLGR
jgi:hypothetical protein